MPENKKDIEKRRCHRVNIELPVCFELLGAMYLAKTVDISATGLCILSRQELKIGDKVTVQVTLPGLARVILDVKVIWVRTKGASLIDEYRMGLQIVKTAKSDQEKYVRFYARQLKKAFAEKK